MQKACLWEHSTTPQICSVRDCENEVRLFCSTHPEDGYFCQSHRNRHAILVAESPHSVGDRVHNSSMASSLEDYIADLPFLMRRELIREGLV